MTRDNFKRIPALHRQIEHDRAHLVYLREKATCIPSSASGSPDRVQTSVSNHAGYYVDAAADLAREIRALETELQGLQDQASEFIHTLGDGTARRLMTYRYIECLSWTEAADLIGYTVRHAHRLENDVLEALET